MKRRTILTVVSISILFTLSVIFKTVEETIPVSKTNKQIENELLTKLSNALPESAEAKKLNRQLTKLKKIRKGNYKRAENPGALMDAFREIKTAPDGKTYESDYRRKELEKAKSRFSKSMKKSTSLAWVERGPYNISGRARVVLADPDDPQNTWYVGSVGGGVWKTTDGGNTWTNKTPQLTTLSTTTMAICESNPNVMYIGTGMGYGRTVDLAGNGVWKSTDRGETWTHLQSTANGELLPAINRIIVDPNDPDVVLVCSNGDYTSFGPNLGSRESAIFRSEDGGNEWTEVFNSSSINLDPVRDGRIQQIIARPDDFNVVFATVNEVGVLKSTDAGKTWRVVADDFANPGDIGVGEGTYTGVSTRIEIGIAPTNPDKMYASIERRSGNADLYYSYDAGERWFALTDINDDPNFLGYDGVSGALMYTAGWFTNTVAVDPYNENIVFVGGVELYKITIYPENHTRHTSMLARRSAQVHADLHYITIVPVSESSKQYKILIANDGGMTLSTNNGVSWNQISGMGTTQFYGMDKKPGENVYIGGMQDNSTGLSGINPTVNSEWRTVIGGDGFEALWNHENPDQVIGCSQYGRYSRSTDGGNSWFRISEASAGNGPFISKIGFSKADPDVIYTVGSSGVKRSDDFGASWTLTPISKWIGWRPFDNVEVSIADPQVVWISSRMTAEPRFGDIGGVYVSKDGGLTFDEISDRFPSNLVEASGISTHPYESGTAYFLFSIAGLPKVIKTTDYGQTFEDLSGFTNAVVEGLPISTGTSSNGFPDVAVYQILVMPYNTDIIWAGTEIGLFISEDAGQTWDIADNGLPNVGIFQMSIVDEQVLVTTYGRGLWTVDLPELDGYTPPQVTRVPRLQPLVQNTSGEIQIDINLRSQYDSTIVFVDGTAVIRLGETGTAQDTSLFYPVLTEKTITASVVSYHNGREYKTPSREISASPIAAINYFVSGLDSYSDQDYFTGDFTVSSEEGFRNLALHTPHPYPDGADLISRIKNPIRVASQNALFTFDEVVLIEEGEVNDYTNSLFYDYAIIEGSRDGQNWIPLGDGYDSRSNNQWSEMLNSNIVGSNSLATGNSTLFVKRTIDLLNYFSAGDLIFIRFRLHSDGLAFAWGWAIDNISIQGDYVSVMDNKSVPSKFGLDQNYPNPFNPSTTIKYSIPETADVKLLVFDITGEQVVELVNEQKPAGVHTVRWDGRNSTGASVSAGVYFYRLQTADQIITKKMILLK